MQDSFDALEYVSYLRQRWLFICTACGIAVLASLLVSLLLPKRYTATASILIEAPAGNDVRTATAVSPVYLESLRSYEYFASSDTLFQKALEHFNLRGSAEPASIESMKRRVLKVSKVRDTRILEINATLPDPRRAQAFVQFLAEETVKLNQSLGQAGDHDLIGDAETQQSTAKAELEKAQSGWTQSATQEPVEGLQSEIDGLVELRSKLHREMLQAQVDMAESSERQNGVPADSELWKRESAASRTKVALLEKQSRDVDREFTQKSASLALRMTKRDALRAQLKSAQSAYDAAATHLREVRGTAGFRGERLRIVDPGIVPERPSSPNIPLNVLLALAFAAVAAIAYLSIAFQNRQAAPRQPLRFAAKKADG